MMCHLLAPMEVAAWEYSSFRINNASPRMMRAFPNHPVTPMMMMRNVVLRPKIVIRVMSRK